MIRYVIEVVEERNGVLHLDLRADAPFASEPEALSEARVLAASGKRFVLELPLIPGA